MKQFKQTLKRYSLVNFKIFLLLFAVSFGNGAFAQNGGSERVDLFDPCNAGTTYLTYEGVYNDRGVIYQKYHGYITGAITNNIRTSWPTKLKWEVQNGNLFVKKKSGEFLQVNGSWIETVYELEEDVNYNADCPISKDIYVLWNGEGSLTMTISNTGIFGVCNPKVSTFPYTPAGQISCSKPNTSSTICSDQVLYNCKSGTKYAFKAIMGSDYSPNSGRDWKFSWDWSKDLGTWNNFYQLQYEQNVSSNNPYIGYNELNNRLGSLFVKDWTLKQTLYVRRKVEEYYSFDIFSVKDWHNKETSNAVALTMYSFVDPDLQANTVSGNEKLTCGITSETYQLKDNAGNVITDPTKYGITNIQWVIPTSWKGYALSGAWATSIQPEVYTWNPITNIPQGGQVYAILTYADGKVKQTAPITVVPPVSISATVSPALIKMCSDQTASFSANVTTTATQYTASWTVDNYPALSNEGLNYNVSGLTLGASNNVNLSVTDNTNGCFVNYPKAAIIEVGNPGQGWAAYNFYTNNGVNNVAKPASNIVTDEIGQPYYITFGGVYQWKYVTNAWSNVLIANDGNADGEIAMYQPDGAEPIIYYTSIDQNTNNKIIRKIVRVAGVWQNATTIYNSNQTTLPLTLRVALKGNGDVYFRQAGNINKLTAVSGQVPVGATPIFFTTAADNSKFAVSKTTIYYLTLSNNLLNFVGKDLVTKTTIITGYNNAKVGTDVQTDKNDNGYYVDVTNTINQYFKNKFPEDPALPTGMYPTLGQQNYCNGSFGVNFKTGVVYAAGLDNNVYQMYNANPWTKQIISPVAYASAGTFIGNQTGTFAQKGSLVFSNNNAFYVSYDGYVRLITYNTASSCPPSRTREDNANENNADFVTRPISESANNIATMSVFPNPIENQSTIQYTLLEDATVSLVLRNNLGEIVSTLVNESQFKGDYSLDFVKNNLLQGLYFLTYTTNGYTSTVKVIVK